MKGASGTWGDQREVLGLSNPSYLSGIPSFTQFVGFAISNAQGVLLQHNSVFFELLSSFGVTLKDLFESEPEELINPELAKFVIGKTDEQLKIDRIAVTSSVELIYYWVAYADTKLKYKRVSHFRNLYRSFIDNTFELLFRTTLDGQIIFCNNLFISTLGFSSHHEALRFRITDIVDSEDNLNALMKDLAEQRTLKYRQLTFRTTQGNSLVGLVNCTMQTDERGFSVFNWTVLDISERLEYDQSLKEKNEQLAKVNSQMEKFLYSTSHDLRSPLTTILGLVNLCRLDTRNPTTLDYVSKIEQSALKLDQIIRDVMSFSKTNYQRIKTERIDFSALMDRQLGSKQNAIETAGIVVEKIIEGDSPFYSDLERIDIIVENLLRNAVQFYDANKVNPFIRIYIQLDVNQVQIEVADNGIGIGSNHLDSVFNMFYKASLNSKGAGLGLYIVKEAVERLSGSVTVFSEIGFGSIFKLIIPNDKKGKLMNRKLSLQLPD